ncbi:MAG: hypothetical protein IKS35_06245 [Clostridia bacterium]|nr:hypothetical protein [Clostridia bacterium]
MSKSSYYGFTVPVLLGFTLKDLSLALKLSSFFGEKPVLIGPGAPVLGGILRTRCAFRIPAEHSGAIREDLLTDLLRSLPVSYTENRVLLIPLTKETGDYVRRNRSVLDGLFLFSDPETVFRTGPEVSR